MFVFFFSSRRRHTRWTGDWSSDVCSSDLNSIHCEVAGPYLPPLPETALPFVASCQGIELVPRDIYDEEDMRWVRAAIRSEERRVGKECRSRWCRANWIEKREECE